MFLNRKKYLENFGKVSSTEVFLDFGSKKVKFLISSQDLDKFNTFKDYFEKKFASIAQENQDFSLEQNLVVCLYSIFNQPTPSASESVKNAIPNVQESSAVNSSFEKNENLFTQQEVIDACGFILKNILND